MKQCSICKEVKEINEFYSQKKKRRDEEYIYYQPYCKSCSIKKVQKNREKDYDEYKRVRREYMRERSGTTERIKRDRLNSKKRRENGDYKEWQQKNKDKIKDYNQLHRKHDIIIEQWIHCKGYFNNQCAYCGLSIEEHYITYKGITKLGDFHKEHVDHNGANDLSNCVPACKSCNVKKHTFKFEDWYNELNENYTEERYEKIIKWLNGDYKLYIEN